MNNKNLSLMLVAAMLISNINLSAMTLDEAKATGRKYAKEIAGATAAVVAVTIGSVIWANSVKSIELTHTVEDLFKLKDDKKTFAIFDKDALKDKKVTLFAGLEAKYTIAKEGQDKSDKNMLKLASIKEEDTTVYYLNLKSRKVIKFDGLKEVSNVGTKDAQVYFVVKANHDATKLAELIAADAAAAAAADAAAAAAAVETAKNNAWFGNNTNLGKVVNTVYYNRSKKEVAAEVVAGVALIYGAAAGCIDAQFLNPISSIKHYAGF